MDLQLVQFTTTRVHRC